MKFPKSIRLGKCLECSDIDDQRLRCHDEDADKNLRSRKATHLSYISHERQSYHQRRANGAHFPSQFCSLIIDFSERIPVPHHTPCIKSWLRLSDRYSITPAGILDHGCGHFIYHCPSFVWSKDPNMVLSVLFTHIKHRATRMQHQPPTLYLQADNCYAKNKNQFMLAFLSMLVLCGVFREIYLYFLPSGHTHEDVDQMFSVFRKELNISSAELPEDLLALLCSSIVNLIWSDHTLWLCHMQDGEVLQTAHQVC